MAIDVRMSDEERTLIVQLLEREQDDLPVEVHHTHTPAVKDQLRHRSNTVRDLLEKLRMVNAAA